MFTKENLPQPIQILHEDEATLAGNEPGPSGMMLSSNFARLMRCRYIL